MNRGFNYYFREGVSSSARTLYRNGGLLKAILWIFIELIALATVVFYPLVSLAKVRQGESVRLKNKLDLSQSFKDSGRPYSVWTLVLTSCVQALMYLAGVLLIALLTFLLGLAGYAIASLADIATREEFDIIVGCFMLPGAAAFIIYSVAAALIFAPAPYMVANNPEAGVGDILSSCFNTMKCSGKLTLFLNVFVPSLIVSLYIALSGGVLYLIDYFLNGEAFVLILLAAWLIIAVIGLALIAPIFLFAARSANQHLFTDIAVDPAAARANINGINLVACRGDKVGSGALENTLVSLFDDAEADGYSVLDKINGREDDGRAARAFMPVDLSEALDGGGRKKKKDKRRTEAEEEELPTVSDVLSGEESNASEMPRVPSVDADETSVEPSVEKIIMDAERRAAEERAEERNKTSSVAAGSGDTFPEGEGENAEEGDGLDEPAEDTSSATAEGDGTLPEGEGESAEEGDGLDEPAEEGNIDGDKGE